MKTKRKATSMPANEPQGKKSKVASPQLSTDAWHVICTFADAATLCRVARINKTLAAMLMTPTTGDKYWQVLVFQRWPLFYWHHKQSCKNWKQAFVAKYKPNWETTFWSLIEKHNGKHEAIQKDIEQNYLDNISELDNQYNNASRAIYDAFGNAGIFLEDDHGMDAQAYLVSCGKKHYDIMLKNPMGYAKNYGLEEDELFQYIWGDYNYDDYIGKIELELKKLVVKA